MATTGLPPKDALQRVIDSLQTLIREHLALARVEAKEDLRNMARDAAVSAAGVPALFVGYLLLMIAAGYGLSTVLPTWAGFAIVAAANLAVGGFLTFVWGRRAARSRVDMKHTGEELQKDKAWLATLAASTEPARQNGEVQQRPAVAPQRPAALATQQPASPLATPRPAGGLVAVPPRPLAVNRQQ